MIKVVHQNLFTLDVDANDKRHVLIYLQHLNWGF